MLEQCSEITHSFCRDATGWSLQSNIFQTFPVASLRLARFWISSNNYSKFFNLQSCTWFLGRCLGEEGLGGSSSLSLPFPPHQCLWERSTNAQIVVPRWRVCQNAAVGSEAAGLASPGKGVKWLIPLQGEHPAAPDFPALLTPATVWGRALESKPKAQTKGPTPTIARARMHPQLLNCCMQLPSKLEGNYPNSVYNLRRFIL